MQLSIAGTAATLNLPARLPQIKVALDHSAVTGDLVAVQFNPSFPHLRLIERVERALAASRLTVVNQAHALSHAGDQYFGLLQVQNGSENPDYAWVLGLRNSHDKRFPAGIVAGAAVFVCDNLSFSGEVELARKHTHFIERDLPQLTERAIGQLVSPSRPRTRRTHAASR